MLSAAIIAQAECARANDVPLCQFGDQCFRTLPRHYKLFRHHHVESITQATKVSTNVVAKAVSENLEYGASSVDEIFNLVSMSEDLDTMCVIPCQLQAWPLEAAMNLKASITAALQQLQSPDDGFESALVDIIVSYTQPKHRRFAYIPLLKQAKDGEDEIPVTVSMFGGKPYLSKGEAGGFDCGVCKCKMTFFFQLYGDDLPEHLQSAFIPESLRTAGSKPLFQFFLCNDNYHALLYGDLSHDSMYMRWIDASQPSVELSQQVVNSQLDEPVASHPKRLLGWKEVIDRPSVEDLPDDLRNKHGLSFETCNEYFDQVNEFFHPVEGEKLSGFRSFLERKGVCRDCGARRELFFQFDNQYTFDRWEPDYRTSMYIVVCPNHREEFECSWTWEDT